MKSPPLSGNVAEKAAFFTTSRMAGNAAKFNEVKPIEDTRIQIGGESKPNDGINKPAG
jgi:hypothetical protein